MLGGQRVEMLADGFGGGFDARGMVKVVDYEFAGQHD